MEGKKQCKDQKVKKHFKVKQYKKGFTIYTKDDLFKPRLASAFSERKSTV